MFEGPVLKTERLILRVPHMSDFDAFAAMNTDEDNKRFIGWGLDRSAQGKGYTTEAGGSTTRPASCPTVTDRCCR